MSPFTLRVFGPREETGGVGAVRLAVSIVVRPTRRMRSENLFLTQYSGCRNKSW